MHISTEIRIFNTLKPKYLAGFEQLRTERYIFAETKYQTMKKAFGLILLVVMMASCSIKHQIALYKVERHAIRLIDSINTASNNFEVPYWIGYEDGVKSVIK